MTDYELVELIIRIIVPNTRFQRKIRNGDRSPAIVKLRDTSIYFIRQLTELSSTEIGNLFSHDHSTVLSAIKREKMRLERNIPCGLNLKWVDYHAGILKSIEAVLPKGSNIVEEWQVEPSNVEECNERAVKNVEEHNEHVEDSFIDKGMQNDPPPINVVVEVLAPNQAENDNGENIDA
jgi:hypothetical protein